LGGIVPVQDAQFTPISKSVKLFFWLFSEAVFRGFLQPARLCAVQKLAANASHAGEIYKIDGTGGFSQDRLGGKKRILLAGAAFWAVNAGRTDM
jgi:hypothetical protein